MTPLIFLPADLTGPKIGGIQSFVKGFVKFAPDDFRIECIGTSTTSGPLPIGQWTEIEVEGRTIRYLPVMSTAGGEGLDRVPVALRYTLALARRRQAYSTRNRILNFHRAGIPLALFRDTAAKVQYVHLNVADIYRERGESRWRLLPGAYHRVEDLTIRQMARVFVVNEAGVEFYRHRHPAMADRVRFLPTWYDDTIFGLVSDAERQRVRAEVRRQLGFPSQARLLLFVGRLEAQKDPQLLVRAFADARRHAPDLRLAIVGGGNLRAEIQQLVESLGERQHVAFVGVQPRPEVARLMTASDALVLSSRFEGMPISVIEALACGLRVVAMRVGEVPRLAIPGKTGMLVEHRTPTAIRDGIIQALALPAQTTREACVAVSGQYRGRSILEPVYAFHRVLSEDRRIRTA